ncbi:DUF6461 domain-containing protein [Streptomyces apocyni]|uniref:DUF6461 domain-containing protein n=1 Tax=Streptomyces apocyni TaxID=2654677 RepID=UPI0012EA4903|nr:DUF6461 domain-containing protein [Streptomyces apocyni]
MTDPSTHTQLLETIGLSEAATFTVVSCAYEAAVIRLFGGDPSEARPATLDDFPETVGEDVIFVSRSGPTVVVIENNGFQGSREEVLRPLSQLGRTASAYWNVNANNELSLAEDGLVLSSLDMLMPEDRYGTRPDAWQPLLHGIDFDAPGWGSALTALQRATGARLDTAWAAGPHQAVDIVPVRRTLVPQHVVGSPLLDQEPFASYARDLGPGLLPELRRYAAELAIAHAGIPDHPLVIAALAAEGTPTAARERLRDELTAAYHDGVYEARKLTITDPQDNRPKWQLPSRLASRRAIVLHGLAETLDLDLPSETGYRPDPMGTFGVVMQGGEGDLVDRFWLLHHLYEAAQGQ